MDILVSTIVGDLVSRSASFVIGKYFRQQPGIDEILQRLQRVVPRIDTVVEEAEGRHITNQGMLRQLKMLRQAIYRGHYVLDALRFQPALDEEEEVSHSSTAAAALSESSTGPAKRLRFSGGGSKREAAALFMFGANKSIREDLQRAVGTLEDTMDSGMKEFIFFLESYPRVPRQPYCTYLLLENCMFGRQTERELVLNFLLRPSTSAIPSLPVLPIIGPLRVGKSTLVEHVCRDEHVRDHFSKILFFAEGSLEDEGVIDLRGSSNFEVRYQNSASQSDNRLLVIVEVAEEIREGTWRRLKSSVSRMAPCGGSKIIVTSRSDRIMDLGTTEALRLRRLPPDAHWYFFKSLAFGSTDPDEHPNLARMAMEIANAEPRRCWMGTHVVAGILRENFDARLWRAVLERVRQHRKMHRPRREDEPPALYNWRLGRSCKHFLICKHHRSDSSGEVPKISLHDVVLGRGGRLPRGEFQALALRTSIPPYYNYTVSCIVTAPQPTTGRKKPVIQEEGDLV
ncbi:unnamed protein product [Alopecurus aequalis]